MTLLSPGGRLVASLTMILALMLVLGIGCGPSAPAPAPAAVTQPVPSVDQEALRVVVQEAVAAGTTETMSSEEVKRMVETAVAASASPGIAPDEVAALVANAMAESVPPGVTAKEVESLVANAVSGIAPAGVTAQEVESSVAKAVAAALADQQTAAQPTLPEEPSSFVLTDIAGRTITIERPVERVILGEARQIYIVAALQPGNPFNRIVGWRNDLRRFDADTYNKYKESFPEVADIPEFGSPYSGEFSVERAIALDADVVTLNLGGLERAKEAGMIDQLAEVGIPVVVIDYRQKPLENTVPSTFLLGRLFDQEERAQEIVDFYLQQVNQVYSRIEQIEMEKEKPVVFLDRAAGIRGADNCCGTFGRANLGLIIEEAGGINLGSDMIPGWAGNLNPEQIIVSDPDVIIATGSNWFTYNPDGDFVSMGYFTDPADSRLALTKLAERRPGWETLSAITGARYHAVWHQFYNSPYHFVVLQQFAKWFYPEEFADVDPVANFAEFHNRFLPIDYSGTFMVSVNE